MAKVVRKYGAVKRAVVICRTEVGSLAESIGFMQAEEYVSPARMEWSDIADDYKRPTRRSSGRYEAVSENSDAAYASSDSSLSSKRQRAAAQTKEEKQEAALIAANAKRRRAASKNSKRAKLERETQALLDLVKAWREDFWKSDVKQTQKKNGKNGAATAQPKASKDEIFSQKATACIQNGAGCTDAAPCGTCALLLIVEIDTLEANKVRAVQVSRYARAARGMVES